MAKQRKLRWGRWVLVGIPTLVLISVAAWAMATRSTETYIRRQAKSYDIPLTTKELFRPAASTAGDNAALYTPQLDAANSAVKSPKVKDADFEKGFDLERAKALLAEHDGYYQVLDRAVAHSGWAVKREGDLLRVSFPEYGTWKLAAKRLALRSRVRSAAGDFDGALADYKSGLRIADFMGSEPTLIGQLVKVACVSIADRSCADLLPMAAHNENRSKALRDALDSVTPVNFDRAFTGEAAFEARVGTQPFDSSMLMADSVPTTEQRFASAWAEATRFHWARECMDGITQTLTEIRKDPTNPSVAQDAQTKHLVPRAESKDPRMVGAQIMMPIFSQFILSSRSVGVQRDLLKCALASLKAGGPQVAGTVDAFGSGEFKSLVTPTGWKVYSVGQNGVDDQGNTGAKEASKADIVIEWDGTQIMFKGR